MYIDENRQDWDCREECEIANRALRDQITQQRIDVSGLRGDYDALRAAHDALVSAQRAALEAAPDRDARREVVGQFMPLLAASSQRLSALCDAARERGAK